MNKFKMIAGVLLLVVFAASCGKTSYKKTAGGMPYKLYRSKDTQQVRVGNFIRVSITTTVNDSVIFTTSNGLPFIQQVTNQVRPYDIS